MKCTLVVLDRSNDGSLAITVREMLVYRQASGLFRVCTMCPQTNPFEQDQILLDEEVRTPRMFCVLLHNDNYTTMEFVVSILVEIFHKSSSEAATIMLAVHEKGIGSCGVYPYEIAETKVALVRSRARQAGCPLKCTMEEFES